MFAASKTASVSGGYQISRSLRFNSADSAYLNRTPASASNRTTWTWSAWVKRSTLGSFQSLFSACDSDAANTMWVAFTSSDSLAFSVNDGDSYIVTTPVYRDVSAWYHVVAVYDSNNATSSDRIKFYVNGVQITSFSTATYPTSGLQGFVNNTVAHALGARSRAGFDFYLRGYMTEINFVDGTVLTPSSFGETDTQTGVWKPKAYSGSYGTNGFYLNFSDNSNTTSTTLGKDYSGNGNNWTPNGFSVSSGVGNDSMVDVPTPYGVDTGVGGTVRGNYCTLNPLDKSTAGGSARNGNLDYAATQASWDMIRSTFGISSGKWYWEVSVNSSTFGITGIAKASVVLQNNFFNSGDSLGYNSANGNKYDGNGGVSSYGASWQASGDICGVALDMDAGTMTFYKNGTSQGVAYTGITGTYFPTHSLYDTSTATFNFGQRPFVHAAPSGFKALCTQNLPTPTIGATTATQANKFFTPNLRVGTGASGSTISTTVNMANGALLWDKSRSSAGSHYWVDSVRGISNTLSSDTIGAEASFPSWFTNFGTNTYTVGSSDWSTGITVVDWIWAANGSGSTNTSGSITSTVSANTTSGFSIVTWAGPNNNTTSTVGHGLGVVPSMVIYKARTSGTANWTVYFGPLSNSASNVLYLNLTNGLNNDTNVFNNTAPTSTLLTVKNVEVNGASMVAYCFAEVAGYSKFGSYTGNGSTDGPFIYCGFRPAFVLVKKSDSGSESWVIVDTTRNTSNVMNSLLRPNTSDAEATATWIDALSNGFKCRETYTGLNASGGTYIYMAFAEVPLKFSLAR